MDRLVAPVSNLATLVALCAVVFGAVLKVKRMRAMPFVLQLIGSCGVVLGTLISVFVRGVLVGTRLGQEMPAAEERLYYALWMLATLIITIGFVCFAWGYVTSEVELLPDRGQSSTGGERS